MAGEATAGALAGAAEGEVGAGSAGAAGTDEAFDVDVTLAVGI